MRMSVLRLPALVLLPAAVVSALLAVPNEAGSANLSATDGKVTLASSSAALTCGSDSDAATGVVDFAGYGTANDHEAAPAPAGSNATSVSRSPTGSDTDNNSADFTSRAPLPQSCTSTNTCPAAEVSSIAEIQGAAHLSPLGGDARWRVVKQADGDHVRGVSRVATTRVRP